MEVEEMIHKLREEQGRPLDVKQLTKSCVSNVMMSMLFGHRFDHSDPAFQQLIFDFDGIVSNLSPILEIFPVLRFLPYFKTNLAEFLRCQKKVLRFIDNNISTCIEVPVTVFSCNL